jgi:hypothetical protein
MMLPLLAAALLLQDRGQPWPRHAVDASSRGADGARLADFDRDGRPDIVAAWEEGGVVRVYRHPGPEKVRSPWPAVTVLTAPSFEDAVAADLDGDGELDVVGSCEGKEKSIHVAWGPSWAAEPLPAARNRAAWMFALPMQVDGRRGVDLVVGAKSAGAELGWFESPERPRDLAAWAWHPLRKVGWTMSLLAADMDGDGDLDLVASDRKGPASGCFWLENDAGGAWPEHAIGGRGREVMFMDLADLDGDGLQDAVVATKPADVLLFRRLDRSGTRWEASTVPYPERTGGAKSVAVGDLDGDGKPDLVLSCEGAKGELSGVVALLRRGDAWIPREISGPAGTKFDRVQLVDLDGDGDLDVLTCEETENLGVIWYENR